MTRKDRSYHLYLEDMDIAIEKILKYTDGMSFDEFKENEIVVDAVIRNFEVIGEASNSIPQKVKRKYPAIPWREMYGLRNFVVHEYFGVDYETIWTIITENLPNDKDNVKSALLNEQK